MPFYRNDEGKIVFMSPRYWKHAVKLSPGLQEVVPEPIKEVEIVKEVKPAHPQTEVVKPEFGYTQINALEGKEKPKRNVSTAAKLKRKTNRKVR